MDQNKNQVYIKNFDVVSNDMILCLWTDLLDIISTGTGGGGEGGKLYYSPIQIEKYNQNQIVFFLSTKIVK